MHLLDKIFEIDELVAEGFTPFQLFQRILREVASFNVAIHTDVIQNVLQVKLLFRGEIVTLNKMLVNLESPFMVDAIDYTDKGSHIILVRMPLSKFVKLILSA